MYEGDMMMTKSKDPRSFLTRMAQIGLGLLMIAGAGDMHDLLAAGELGRHLVIGPDGDDASLASQH